MHSLLLFRLYSIRPEVQKMCFFYRQNGGVPLFKLDRPEGSRNGVGAREGRGRFHGIKQGCPGSRATDVFGVNPEAGDVVDPNGDIVGNLGDMKSK